MFDYVSHWFWTRIKLEIMNRKLGNGESETENKKGSIMLEK